MTAFPRKVFDPVPPEVERVGKAVLDAAFTVHSELGPGLLESVYRIAMKHVIDTSGIMAETEVKIPILFRGVKLESGLRLDLLVNQCVIAELKSVEKMNPVYEAQLLTYSPLEQGPPGIFNQFLCASFKRRYKANGCLSFISKGL